MLGVRDAARSLAFCVVGVAGSKVRKAAGILFELVGYGEDGVLKLVVAELLKRHCRCDGGKHRDVCRQRESTGVHNTVGKGP